MTTDFQTSQSSKKFKVKLTDLEKVVKKIKDRSKKIEKFASEYEDLLSQFQKLQQSL